MIHLRRVSLYLTTALFWIAGCTEAEWNQLWQKDKKEQPSAAPRSQSDSHAVRDTIAPLVTLDGLRLTQVRGFGLVVDLVDTGGRDGPDVVRDYLVKEIRARQEIGAPGIPPGELLGSRDCAMVELLGYLPAGAQQGDTFDVTIVSLGSETESLVGGRLALGELKLYAEAPSGVLSSKTLAVASGPILVSPFDRDGDRSDRVDLKRGVVLGGGVVKTERTIRIVLNSPSYSQSKLIERRLNSRYGGDEPICKGLSPSALELTIPKEFRHRKSLFLTRVLHTTLRSDTDFLEQRGRDLCGEFKEPKPTHDTIGVALEAVGKLAMPEVQRFFTDPSPETRFYAGRTALRLDERDGVDVVAKFAEDRESSHRLEAIDELGWAVRQYSAGEVLRKLLDDADEKIRIAAYKALRRRSHPVIETKVLDTDNLILDVVDSKGPFLIYIQRTTAPRIAIFGRSMKCSSPLIFPGVRKDQRRLVAQLSAQADDDHLTFIYKNKRNGKMSPPQEAPLNVAELIEYLGGAPHRDDNDRLLGFAIPYSELIDILATLCDKDMAAIPAKLVIEGIDESTKHDRERPESEF